MVSQGSYSHSADFFISYKADSPPRQHETAWAEWVAQTLEDHGYSTILQQWDFRVGSNIIVNIDHALKQCTRMIALLSPAYLEDSRFTQAEWAAKLMESPDGAEARLIPVIVRECQPAGILSPLVYQRLCGDDVERDTKALLDAVNPDRLRRAARYPGRRVRNGLPSIDHAQTRDALIRGGITRFHLTRSDYEATLREYLGRAEVSITLASIYLTAKGNENDLLELFERKLRGSATFQIVVSLLNPTAPVISPAALALSMTEVELGTQVESMARSLLKLRNTLPGGTRRRLSVKLHSCLPPASAILLDENLQSGRIQLETRLYRAPGSESFGYEVQSGTEFYSRLLNSYHKLLRDSVDARKVFTKNGTNARMEAS